MTSSLVHILSFVKQFPQILYTMLILLFLVNIIPGLISYYSKF
jgi:hypothetical protein